MRKPDDADRPAVATIDTTYALTRTVAPARPDRVPATTPASVVARPRSVSPHRLRAGMGEYLIVARRRP